MAHHLTSNETPQFLVIIRESHNFSYLQLANKYPYKDCKQAHYAASPNCGAWIPKLAKNLQLTSKFVYTKTKRKNFTGKETHLQSDEVGIKGFGFAAWESSSDLCLRFPINCPIEDQVNIRRGNRKANFPP